MTTPTVTTIGAEEFLLEYSEDSGASWRNIPGIEDYTEEGAERPSRDIVPAAGEVGKRLGRPRVPSLAFQSYAVPAHPSWRRMRELMDSGDAAQFRITTKEITLYNGAAQAAIATSGAVTLSGTPLPTLEGNGYGVGAVIKIGGAAYAIDTMDDDGSNIVVHPAPTSAVSAAAFTIVVPSIRRGPFTAAVTNTDQFSLQNEGELKLSLMLQPLTRPGASTIVA